MIENETKLMEDQSFDYRKTLVGILSLTKAHYSTEEISSLMKIRENRFFTLYRQNDRIPKPYDWDEVIELPEKERSLKFYQNEADRKKYREKFIGIDDDDDENEDEEIEGGYYE